MHMNLPTAWAYGVVEATNNDKHEWWVSVPVGTTKFFGLYGVASAITVSSVSSTNLSADFEDHDGVMTVKITNTTFSGTGSGAGHVVIKNMLDETDWLDMRVVGK
mgnify:CR=1 FL=1